jgi:hypothetical protein
VSAAAAAEPDPRARVLNWELSLAVGLALVLTLSGVKLLDAPPIFVLLVLAGGLALIDIVVLRDARQPGVELERT